MIFILFTAGWEIEEILLCRQSMPSSGLMLSNGSSVVGNGGSRMDGTLSQSMDSVNTVAAEEEVKKNIFLP